MLWAFMALPIILGGLQLLITSTGNRKLIKVIPITIYVLATIVGMMCSDYATAFLLAGIFLVPTLAWVLVDFLMAKRKSRATYYDKNRVFTMAAACVLLVLISVTFNINQLRIDALDEFVFGQWRNQEVDIEIHEGKTVTGKLGSYEIRSGEILLNRNSFERMINIKTDYIIVGEFETEEKFMFTFPFNEVDDEIRGSVFHIIDYQYPEPILTSVVLKKRY